MRALQLFRFCTVCLILGLLAACSSTTEAPEEVSDTKNRAAELAEFGNNYMNQAQFEQALRFYTLALENNIAVDNQEGIVLSRNSVGEANLALGQLERAESAFVEGLDMARKIERRDLELRTLNNLGKLALHRGDHDKAREILDEALDIIHTLSSPPPETEADVYHSLGALYKISGDYDKARENLEKSLDINQSLKRLSDTASSFYMLGSVFSKTGDYAKAEDNIHFALDIDKKTENTLGIADDYYALGLIAEKQGDLEEAYEHFETALEKYIILNTVANTLETLYSLRRTAAALERDEEADSFDRLIARIEGRSTK